MKRLIGVGFLFGLARFSESFLILKAMDGGLSVQWSPLVLALFNLAFLVLAYPAGVLSDLIAAAPRPACRDRLAGCRRFVARAGGEPWAVVLGVRAVGGAHGADAGDFQPHDRRCGRRGPARDELRGVLLRQRDRRLAVQFRRGPAMGGGGPGDDLCRCRRAGRACRRGAGGWCPKRARSTRGGCARGARAAPPPDAASRTRKRWVDRRPDVDNEQQRSSPDE